MDGGGAVRRRGGGGTLRDGARLPAEVRFTGISFSYNLSYAIFGGPIADRRYDADGASPMAPAWYVLALSLMGWG